MTYQQPKWRTNRRSKPYSRINSWVFSKEEYHHVHLEVTSTRLYPRGSILFSVYMTSTIEPRNHASWISCMLANFAFGFWNEKEFISSTVYTTYIIEPSNHKTQVSCMLTNFDLDFENPTYHLQPICLFACRRPVRCCLIKGLKAGRELHFLWPNRPKEDRNRRCIGHSQPLIEGPQYPKAEMHRHEIRIWWFGKFYWSSPYYISPAANLDSWINGDERTSVGSPCRTEIVYLQNRFHLTKESHQQRGKLLTHRLLKEWYLPGKLLLIRTITYTKEKWRSFS